MAEIMKKYEILLIIFSIVILISQVTDGSNYPNGGKIGDQGYTALMAYQVPAENVE